MDRVKGAALAGALGLVGMAGALTAATGRWARADDIRGEIAQTLCGRHDVAAQALDVALPYVPGRPPQLSGRLTLQVPDAAAARATLAECVSVSRAILDAHGLTDAEIHLLGDSLSGTIRADDPPLHTP